MCSVTQLCWTLCDPMDLKPARLLCPWNVSWQEHWSGLPFPSPGDLPDSWIKPVSPESPALAGGFFTIKPPRKPLKVITEKECLKNKQTNKNL